MIDSCFQNILDVMYGGVDLMGKDVEYQSHPSDEALLKTVESDEAIRLLSGRHLENKADRSENVTRTVSEREGDEA